jgi:hypothetical protein
MLSRAELRAELTRKRAMYFPKSMGRYALCAICGCGLTEAGEIHESIITRGMLRDADRSHLILVPENSNLVHTKCHPESGRGGIREFSQCAINLMIWEKDHVIEWLDSLDGEFNILAQQAKRDYLNAINDYCWRISADSIKKIAPKTHDLLKEMNDGKN